MRVLGGGHRSARQRRDHAPGDRACGLDTKKKSLIAVERDAAARAAFLALVATLDPAQIVVGDECGSHIDLVRLYGRAPRGERLVAAVPRNRGQATTLVAALTLDGLVAPLTITGGMTKEVFVHWVTHHLAPTLLPGQIVIWDNLRSHDDPRAAAAVQARGAAVWRLPAYSPDLSPIELAFGVVKAALRRIGARTREALEAAIAPALTAITPAAIRGWFAHAGYPAPAQHC